MQKRIVILGPESTGKSELTLNLAEYFEAPYVPEYAREFLTLHGTAYSYDDLLTIAKGQVALEEKVLGEFPEKPLVFIDTDMHVMKVWCEFVFNKCHTYILDQLKTRQYDLFLLCNVDLPWTRDELREYPDLETRQKLYDIYRETMESEKLPWVDISGNYAERLDKAIAAVKNL